MNTSNPTYINVSTQGSGEVLSLLHGWGMNSAVYEPMVESLASEFTLSSVDLPGHGQSGWTSCADSIDDIFELQLSQMADSIPDSTLVGWSLGGLYAMKLAARYPERFKRLILVASNPCFVQRENWSAAVDDSVFSGFADDFIDNWQKTIRRFLGLQMFGVENTRALIRHISGLLVKGGEPHPDALRFGLELLLTQDARKELQQAGIPVMVVLGNRDKLVPISLANELAKLNPEIRVECLAHSAHVPFLSHLEDFTGLIREFVKPAPA